MSTATLSTRYVFYPNVVISALGSRGGSVAWMRSAWPTGRVTPVVSQAPTLERTAVLTYPRFTLDNDSEPAHDVAMPALADTGGASIAARGMAAPGGTTGH